MSNDWADTEAAASVFLDFAAKRGVDLAQFHGHSQFLNEKNGRYIVLWKKGTGLGYSMQGKVSLLPREFADSASAFYGMWHESGTLPDLDQAFRFLQAWLIEGIEVDQLPVQERERRRYGIG
jgi:hypothetical protein